METDSHALRTAKTLQKLGIGIELTGFWYARLYLPNKEQTVSNITKESLVGKPIGVEALFDRIYIGDAFDNIATVGCPKDVMGWKMLSALVRLDYALSTLKLNDLMYWFDGTAQDLGSILAYIA